MLLYKKTFSSILKNVDYKNMFPAAQRYTEKRSWNIVQTIIRIQAKILIYGIIYDKLKTVWQSTAIVAHYPG